MRILIIEDSAKLSRSLGYGLAAVGHEVDRVADGRGGLDLATRKRYDLILLDIMLPGLDGFGILSGLKAKRHHVPILILSARDAVDDRVRGLAAGADDYLVKPFSFRELLARVDALARQRQRGLRDEGSGVSNGSAFRLRIEDALEEVALSPGEGFAIMILELQGMSLVTNSLGPTALDDLLAQAGRAIEGCCGERAFVARLSAERLGVVIGGLGDLSEVYVTADSVREALRLPLLIGDREFYPSVSIGIVWVDDEYESAEEILRDAGAALHRATELGSERCVLFHPAMRERVMHEFVREHDLRRALRDGEFFLEYQPIVEIGPRKATGLEALLRWRHPSRGVLGPAEFLMSLEESGLIVPVGDWALREACRQLAEWRRTCPECAGLSVAVNLAAKQLTPALVEMVRSTLAEFGLAGRDLCLEVTETMMIDVPRRVLRIFQSLRETGIRISLDDFGTGYSSLKYLQQLPFDTLKIDRSFVSPPDEDPTSRRIVRSIVELAKDLGLETVAEGVEDEEQLRWLRDLECDRFQGYLFSKPIGAVDVESLLGSGASMPSAASERARGCETDCCSVSSAGSQDLLVR